MRAVGCSLAILILLTGCAEVAETMSSLPAPELPSLSTPGLDLTAVVSTAPAMEELPLVRWATPTFGAEIPERFIEEACFGALGRPTEAQTEKALRKGWFGWAAVEVSPTALRVNGATVATLTAGEPSAEELRGILISPLFDSLLGLADDAKGFGSMCPAWDFSGHLLLVVDHRVPWTTLRSVVYTAGQAQYAELGLVTSGAVATAADASGARSIVVAAVGPEGSPTVTATDGRTATIESAGLGAAVDTVLGSRADLGCGTLLPGSSMTAGDVAGAIGWFTQVGVRPVLAGGQDGSAAAVLSDTAPGPTWRLEMGDSVRVQQTTLPAIGMPGDGDAHGPECKDGVPNLTVRRLRAPTGGRSPLLEKLGKPTSTGGLGSRRNPD